MHEVYLHVAVDFDAVRTVDETQAVVQNRFRRVRATRRRPESTRDCANDAGRRRSDRPWSAARGHPVNGKPQPRPRSGTNTGAARVERSRSRGMPAARDGARADPRSEYDNLMLKLLHSGRLGFPAVVPRTARNPSRYFRVRTSQVRRPRTVLEWRRARAHARQADRPVRRDTRTVRRQLSRTDWRRLNGGRETKRVSEREENVARNGTAAAADRRRRDDKERRDDVSSVNTRVAVRRAQTVSRVKPTDATKNQTVGFSRSVKWAKNKNN